MVWRERYGGDDFQKRSHLWNDFTERGRRPSQAGFFFMERLTRSWRAKVSTRYRDNSFGKSGTTGCANGRKSEQARGANQRRRR